MSAKLCILGCQNFQLEFGAARVAEGWPDVTVAAFPARCGRPPLTWDELRTLLPKGCTQVAVIGRACLEGLEKPPADFPPVRLLPQEQCFNMAAGSGLVEQAITDSGYLITPGWLAGWRGHLADMGFTLEDSGEFFRDFARKLVLFDTGVDAAAQVHLREMASATGLPATRIAVGLDHMRLLLAQVVLEWRLDHEHRAGQDRDRRHAQELADHVAAMDLVVRLGKTQTETDAIAAIEELFSMLFAPATWHYVRVELGQFVPDPDLPAELLSALRRLETPYAWTSSGEGFLLRIARGDSLLGLIVVDHLAFPQYRERYLNAALAMTSVCALAIEDARGKSELLHYQQHLKELVERRTAELAEANQQLESRIVARTKELEHVNSFLRESEERFRSLTQMSSDFYWESDAEHRLTERISSNTKLSPVAEFRSGTQLGRRRWEIPYLSPDEAGWRAHRAVLDAHLPFRNFELSRLAGDGTANHTAISGDPVFDAAGSFLGYRGVGAGITERKQLEGQIRQLAFHDALTKLPNRRLLHDRLSQALAANKRSGCHGALMFLDLDNFKFLNDTRGHEVGDLLLIEAADRLKSCLREVDTVARFGGDEFVVILSELSVDKSESHAQTGIIAEKIRAAIAKPYVLQLRRDGNSEAAVEHQCTVSIGVALFGKHADSPDDILKWADTAMYQAKDSGRNLIRFYDPQGSVTADQGEPVSP